MAVGAETRWARTVFGGALGVLFGVALLALTAARFVSGRWTEQVAGLLMVAVALILLPHATATVLTGFLGPLEVERARSAVISGWLCVAVLGGGMTVWGGVVTGWPWVVVALVPLALLTRLLRDTMTLIRSGPDVDSR